MSELEQKLFYKNRAGEIKTCKIYSKLEDMTYKENYIGVVTDNNINGFIPLVDTVDQYATSLRVKKNGTIYAVASEAITPGSITYAWGATNTTWKCPSKISNVKITLGTWSKIFSVIENEEYNVQNRMIKRGTYKEVNYYDYQVIFGMEWISKKYYDFILYDNGEIEEVHGPYLGGLADEDLTGYTMTLEWSDAINKLAADYESK